MANSDSHDAGKYFDICLGGFGIMFQMTGHSREWVRPTLARLLPKNLQSNGLTHIATRGLAWEPTIEGRYYLAQGCQELNPVGFADGA